MNKRQRKKAAARAWADFWTERRMFDNADSVVRAHRIALVLWDEAPFALSAEDLAAMA